MSSDIEASDSAEMLGVVWNALMVAVKLLIEITIGQAKRLAEVDALGVDEHVKRSSKSLVRDLSGTMKAGNGI